MGLLAQQDNTEDCSALIGTLGNGRYGQLQPGTHTTPDAVTVQQLMADYRDQGIQTVIMEVSSHALAQGRINGVEFDTAVLTNLTRDHLDYHGDMQSYAAEKLKLFLTPGLKNIVLNLDDTFSDLIRSELKQQVSLITYARQDSSADYSVSDIRLDNKGIHFKLQHGQQSWPVSAPLIGEFNIDNILAAIAVLAAQGYALRNIITAVNDLQTVPGRMDKINIAGQVQQPLIVIDYAHTPDALAKALQAVRAHTSKEGKLYCIFGCGGDRDQGKRPLMAQAAEEQADQIMITSDNPRSEEPEQIIKDINSGLKNPQTVWTETDRETAIARVLNAAGPQDSVLIAGKGHETYQEINGTRLPFSDRDCVMQFYHKDREGAQ